MSLPFVPLPPWTATCRVRPQHLRLSVTQAHGLDLLEALARHTGHPLDAVIAVDAASASTFDATLCDGALLLGPSGDVRVCRTGPTARTLRLAPDDGRSL